jgi:hypothetical protein
MQFEVYGAEFYPPLDEKILNTNVVLMFQYGGKTGRIQFSTQ